MIKKIIMWTLVVFWMSLIFYFSSFSGVESTNQSKGFLYNTLGNIIDIFDKNISQIEKDELIDKLDHPIRKIAHGSVYFILSILVCLSLSNYNLDIKKLLIITFIICLLYSISDEIHQLFVFGRSGELKDVIIDNIGIIIGLYLFWIFKRKRK